MTGETIPALMNLPGPKQQQQQEIKNTENANEMEWVETIFEFGCFAGMNQLKIRWIMTIPLPFDACGEL